jgi:hypothetical protein
MRVLREKEKRAPIGLDELGSLEEVVARSH